MKKIILISATLMLLSGGFYGCVSSFENNLSGVDSVIDITTIPQGAYEQIYLENEGVTDEEICWIYASDTVYWNEVDRQMCSD